MKTFTIAALALAALVAGAAAHDSTDSCNSAMVGPVGILSDDLQAASGIVASRKLSNVLYMTNGGDNSGDKAVVNLYAVDAKNATNVILKMTLKGTMAVNVQDIAVSVEDDVNYIYVGDIGTKTSGRTEDYEVYKFAEPTQAQLDAGENIDIVANDITTFVLDNIVGIEFQTLMVDQKDDMRTAYVVSKSAAGVPTTVYSFEGKPAATETRRVLANRAGGDTIALKEEGIINFSDIVAGEISNDNRILLKSSQQTFLFTKSADEKVIESLQSNNICLMAETDLLDNDSGITFSKDQNSFYTTGASDSGVARSNLPGPLPVPIDPFPAVYQFNFKDNTVVTEAPPAETDSASSVAFSGLMVAAVAVVAFMV